MQNSQINWNLIYTRPKQEQKVAKRLCDLGIEFYLPLTNSLRQWHDRKKNIKSPLFPSYIFVNLNNKQDVFSCLGIEGCVCFVRMDKQIANISNSIINDIKIVVEKSNSFEVTSDRFLPGKKLTIQKGSLVGLNCEIISWSSNIKALVRMQLLNRNILVELPIDSLLPY